MTNNISNFSSFLSSSSLKHSKEFNSTSDSLLINNGSVTNGQLTPTLPTHVFQDLDHLQSFVSSPLTSVPLEFPYEHPSVHPCLKLPFYQCMQKIVKLQETEPLHAQYYDHALHSLRWNNSYELLQSLLKLNEMEQHGKNFISPIVMISNADLKALQHDLRHLREELENLIRIMTAQNIVQPQQIGVKDYPNKVLNAPYSYGNMFFY